MPKKLSAQHLAQSLEEALKIAHCTKHTVGESKFFRFFLHMVFALCSQEGVFIWEKFIPSTEISPEHQRDLAKRASPPACMKIKFCIGIRDEVRSWQRAPARLADWLTSI